MINYSKFKWGNIKLLIVTDVAARGLDIPFISTVIHYDFPPTSKVFVHRSGRTARQGKKGKCICLIWK